MASPMPDAPPVTRACCSLQLFFMTSVDLKMWRRRLSRFPIQRVQFFQHRFRIAPVAKCFLQGAAAVGLQRYITAVTGANECFPLRGSRSVEKSAAEFIHAKVIPRSAVRRLPAGVDVKRP